MRTKHVLTVAALLIAAIILPSGRVQTQPNVETISVDTLCYLGKDVPGEAAGAFFLPDGNIIVAWKNAPVIIDRNTGEILREFESVASQNLRIPKLSKDGRYFIASSDVGKKVWDVATGKVIKQLKLGEYCLSEDGTRMYCSTPNDAKDPGIIRVYDMNTLEQIERFFDNGFVSADQITISPDGQTLAVSVEKKPSDQYDKKTDQVILINLKDKNNYTVLETLEPQVYSMEFSPDGKNLMFLYNGGNYNIYIYIYNLETKEKKYIKLQELSNLFGIKFETIGVPFFINDNTILYGIRDLSNERKFFIDWNILERRIKYYISYTTARSVVIKDSILLLCNQRGVLAFLNKNIVPVKDIVQPDKNYLIYHNSILEFDSYTAFAGETMIYDTTGKMISNLGVQQFIVGKNMIKVNQLLPTGIYILTIKNQTDQNSYKFMVDR